MIGYAAFTSLGLPEQHYVVHARGAELHRVLDRAFVHANAVVTNNLFTLFKGGTPGTAKAPVARRRAWPKIKLRIKAALLRIGLD